MLTEPGESVPFEVPVLAHAIDLSMFARHLHEQFEATQSGEDVADDLDIEAMNQEMRRRP